MTTQQQFDAALAHHQAGRLQEAIGLYSAILKAEPNFVPALHMFGVLAAQNGRADAAVELIRQAIALQPHRFELHHDFANALKQIGKWDLALRAYREALRLNPDCDTACDGIAAILIEWGQFDEARAAIERAVSIKPDNSNYRTLLGLTFSGVGQIDEAMACYRHALRLNPDNRLAQTSILFDLHNDPSAQPQAIFRQHVAWGQAERSRVSAPPLGYHNDRNRDRRLRIGYVSGDFRIHSVAFFFPPLLQHHNRRNVEIFCYSHLEYPDQLTRAIKERCDHWRDIFGLSDDAVAEQIRADRIDILVDLSGHSARNRLPVFCRKPAPIQVTYLGYPDTTGVKEIDYRLTDALADPPGLTDDLNVEQLFRLPTCAWCYQPGVDAPDVAPERAGPIRFGCFNAFVKINQPLIAIWARILREVPGSQLIIKSSGAGQTSARQRILNQFSRLGISVDRIELRDKTASTFDHLSAYSEIDIALDTYPYHGTTTTCEALWMGVPVITLAGQIHASRVGVSLLTNAHLPQFIAQTPEEYITISARLAQDRAQLSTLRSTLRTTLRHSPLLDAQRFTTDVENAFRTMWHNCLNASST